MSVWALRFLLWFVCVLMVQPQNRFTFLYPYHIADICVVSAVGLHFLSCSQEKISLIKLGPASILAFALLFASFCALFGGALQASSHWNAYSDIVAKGVLLLVLAEAMCHTPQRVWTVQAAIMLAALWWVKGGIRLSLSGATFSDDRIMGPAVSLVVNPNGFAYMMCVVLPIYLYFFQQSKLKIVRYSFLIVALMSVFIVLKTGSRTGFLVLLAVGVFLLPKYGSRYKFAILIAVLAFFVFSSALGSSNIRRFKSIPVAIKSFFVGEAKASDELNQDEQSAQERRFKNRDTWRLIKKYPFGVGMTPDESKYADEFPYATGQVHCEILMAGRQMGFVGMAIYLGLLGILFINGWRVEKKCKGWWPEMADLGWTLKLQAVVFAVGGFFSPGVWNPLMMILAGAASALWTGVRSMNPPAQPA